MPQGVTAAVLLSLALLGGCQKDHIEDCVNDGIKAWGSAWQEKSSGDQAEERFAFRKECMAAAAGRKE